MSAAEKPVEWTCEGSRKLHEGLFFGFHARVKADGALTVNNRVTKKRTVSGSQFGWYRRSSRLLSHDDGAKVFFCKVTETK